MNQFRGRQFGGLQYAGRHWRTPPATPTGGIFVDATSSGRPIRPLPRQAPVRPRWRDEDEFFVFRR